MAYDVDETAKLYLREMRQSFKDFQARRENDAVYGYLKEVLRIYLDIKDPAMRNAVAEKMMKNRKLKISSRATVFSMMLKASTHQLFEWQGQFEDPPAQYISKWKICLDKAHSAGVEPEELMQIVRKEARGVNRYIQKKKPGSPITKKVPKSTAPPKPSVNPHKSIRMGQKPQNKPFK